MNDLRALVFLYAHGLWRRRWMVLGVAWAACTAGWLLIMALPDKYTVTAKLQVDADRLLSPLLREIMTPTDPEQDMIRMQADLLSKPALATLTTFTFMGFWGNYMWPLVITITEELRTLPIGLKYFVGQHSTNYTQLMAGSMIALIPVLLLFVFNQRYFVEGIKLSGIKG